MDLRGQLPTRIGASPYRSRSLDGIVGVTIHYTSGSYLASVEQIALYQTGPLAQEEFPAIAYTLIVDRSGTVYQCHDLNTRSWHNGAVVNGVARNASHIGICFIGNSDPYPEQIQGLANAVRWCEKELGHNLEVEGHSEHFATACPGVNWNIWKTDLLALL